MDQEQQRFITAKPGAKPLNSEEDRRQRTIVGGVVGGVAGLILLLLLAYGGFHLWRYIKNKRQSP